MAWGYSNYGASLSAGVVKMTGERGVLHDGEAATSISTSTSWSRAICACHAAAHRHHGDASDGPNPSACHSSCICPSSCTLCTHHCGKCGREGLSATVHTPHLTARALGTSRACLLCTCASEWAPRSTPMPVFGTHSHSFSHYGGVPSPCFLLGNRCPAPVISP